MAGAPVCSVGALWAGLGAENGHRSTGARLGSGFLGADLAHDRDDVADLGNRGVLEV